jgi:hypothetical protein
MKYKTCNGGENGRGLQQKGLATQLYMLQHHFREGICSLEKHTLLLRESHLNRVKQMWVTVKEGGWGGGT